MARNMDYWIINTAQVLFLPWAHFPMAMVYWVSPMQCAFKVCHRNLASRLPDMASCCWDGTFHLLGISIVRKYHTYYHISCHKFIYSSTTVSSIHIHSIQLIYIYIHILIYIYIYSRLHSFFAFLQVKVQYHDLVLRGVMRGVSGSSPSPFHIFHDSSKGAMRSRATAGVWGFAMIERICTLAVDDTTVFRNYDKH